MHPWRDANLKKNRHRIKQNIQVKQSQRIKFLPSILFRAFQFMRLILMKATPVHTSNFRQKSVLQKIV